VCRLRCAQYTARGAVVVAAEGSNPRLRIAPNGRLSIRMEPATKKSTVRRLEYGSPNSITATVAHEVPSMVKMVPAVKLLQPATMPAANFSRPTTARPKAPTCTLAKGMVAGLAAVLLAAVAVLEMRTIAVHVTTAAPPPLQQTPARPPAAKLGRWAWLAPPFRAAGPRMWLPPTPPPDAGLPPRRPRRGLHELGAISRRTMVRAMAAINEVLSDRWYQKVGRGDQPRVERPPSTTPSEAGLPPRRAQPLQELGGVSVRTHSGMTWAMATLAEARDHDPMFFDSAVRF